MELVRLRIRPSRDGKTFRYLLDYTDENGRRRRISLSHADRRKAERQRAQKERELRMAIVGPESMKLSEFLEDSLLRTGSQIRQSTQCERRFSMKHFIQVIGDIDYQQVELRHGELFRQVCLDKGNSPATVSKKLRQLKRLFQLALDRKQLDDNPLRRIAMPRAPKRKVQIYTSDESERIVRAARECKSEDAVSWDTLIVVALTTGMRRGELLNTVWADIDFEAKTIEVSPKKDTEQTWQWQVKDNERRTLPLTDEAIAMLAELQSQYPENYPYVFVPPCRYDVIQELRSKGKWQFTDSRLKVVNNFGRDFKRILSRAGVREGQFHDFRRTALSNWLANDMSESDVMRLAGHASFNTTHQFYLAVQDGLVDRARAAMARSVSRNLARAWRAPLFAAKSS